MKKYIIFEDEASWCAIKEDFINIQESLSGFGDTPINAFIELLNNEMRQELDRRKFLRTFKCNNCMNVFDRIILTDTADCPSCKTDAQFTYEVKK